MLHEVSNALTVIIGWIERARSASPRPAAAAAADAHLEAGSDSELARALDVAASRASLARSIVRRAIEPDLSATPIEPSATVAEMVDDALTGVEVELAAAGLVATSAVSASLETARIELGATVLQILTNLLLNAVAHSPPGATVRVQADLRAGAPGVVVFAVTDEGPGIPTERRATVFRSGVTTRAGGAGIGLRHAAALARVNGGALALAESQRGARFELTWPLVRRSAAPTLRPPTLRPPTVPPPSASHRALLGTTLPLAGARILLVEDDDAVVDLLDTALTARGADVVSIRHRAELAAALASGPFDAALFDISPVQDDVRGAVALARGAEGENGPVRVVLISGSAAQMPDMPVEWVSAWVRKPFEVSEILAAIAPLAARRSR